METTIDTYRPKGTIFQTVVRGLFYIFLCISVTLMLIYSVAIEHQWWNSLFFIPLYFIGNYYPAHHKESFKRIFRRVDACVHYVLYFIFPPYIFL